MSKLLVGLQSVLCYVLFVGPCIALDNPDAGQPQAGVAHGKTSEKALELLNLLARMTQLGDTQSDIAALSPDGDWVAYTTKTDGTAPSFLHHVSDREITLIPNGTHLHLVNLTTKQVIALSPGSDASWRPLWSPDGKRLAYCVASGTELRMWLYDVQEGREREVSRLPIAFGLNDAGEANWSQTGDVIWTSGVQRNAGFESPAAVQKSTDGKDTLRSVGAVEVYRSGAETEGVHLHAGATSDSSGFIYPPSPIVALKPIDGNGRVVVAASSDPSPGSGFIAPSGRWLAYLSPPRNQVRNNRGHQDLNKVSELTGDLAIVSSRGGAPIIVERDIDFPNDSTSLPMWLVGDRLIYSRAGQLFLVTTIDGRAERTGLAHPGFRVSDVARSRDGNGLLAIGSISAGSVEKKVGVWLSLAPLAPAKLLDLPPDFQLAEAIHARSHVLWQPTLGSVTLSGTIRDDRNNLLLHELVRVNLKSGKSKVLSREVGLVAPTDVSGDHSRLLAEYEDPVTPPDLWIYAADGHRSLRVTNLNPSMSVVPRGIVTHLSTVVPGWDGSTLMADTTVISPVGKAQAGAPPAVVTAYPNDKKSGRVMRFGFGMEAGPPTIALLEQGYAVVYADLPTRPTTTTGDRAREAADVLLPQLQHAIQRGLIDPKRMALFGWSQGGYTALAITTQTNAFRATIAGGSGAYDLPGAYGVIRSGEAVGVHWAEQGLSTGGPPWENLQRYLDNSPYYQVGKIHTPILLLIGDQDVDECVMEHKKMFAALQTYNKTAQLRVYHGEGHGLFTGSAESRVDASVQMLEFLGRYLTSDSQHK